MSVFMDYHFPQTRSTKTSAGTTKAKHGAQPFSQRTGKLSPISELLNTIRRQKQLALNDPVLLKTLNVDSKHLLRIERGSQTVPRNWPELFEKHFGIAKDVIEHALQHQKAWLDAQQVKINLKHDEQFNLRKKVATQLAGCINSLSVPTLNALISTMETKHD